MPHVATDNVPAPPAFTGSTSFPFLFPFKFPFKLFDPRKTICRNGSAALFKFVAIPTAPGSGQGGVGAYSIRAGVGQLISGAELMRRLVCGERRAARSHRSASAGMIFEFFVRAGEERLRCRSIYDASFGRL